MNIDKTRFLEDVPEDKAFWVCNGTNIRNLKELSSALNKMDDATFKNHVNKEE